MGSLTCGEGGTLSTRDLGFIYVSSAGRDGVMKICPKLKPVTMHVSNPVAFTFSNVLVLNIAEKLLAGR
jgi:hypothetical protein